MPRSSTRWDIGVLLVGASREPYPWRTRSGTRPPFRRSFLLFRYLPLPPRLSFPLSPVTSHLQPNTTNWCCPQPAHFGVGTAYLDLLGRFENPRENCRQYTLRVYWFRLLLRTDLFPRHFQIFRRVALFTWQYYPSVTFRLVNEASAAALPVLEFLDVKTPEILSVRAHMKCVSIAPMRYLLLTSRR